jgi:hypothetical protein
VFKTSVKPQAAIEGSSLRGVNTMSAKAQVARVQRLKYNLRVSKVSELFWMRRSAAPDSAEQSKKLRQT